MRRLALALFVACHSPATVPAPPDASPVDAAAAPAPPIVVDARPSPLEGEWIEKLALPDDGIAYVTPPLGAREPRPIIVGIHGAWDDPGLMCSAYRLIVDVYAFVVCPAGRPVDPSAKDGRLFVWSSGDHIAKRVHEAVEATKAKYPGRVADAPMIYVAFSQGSNLAGTLLARDGKSFPRVVFTEGGYKTFDDAATARAFAKGGGERVLFTCSQPGCAGSFATSRAALERAGATARVDYSGPHGHSMPPAVREKIHDALPWIVEGLQGWEGYASAPKLEGH
jgi:hypothetical protein